MRLTVLLRAQEDTGGVGKPVFTDRRYGTPMSITKRQIGLAAVILLAPGGFILGAALLANHYRKPAPPPEKDDTPPSS